MIDILGKLLVPSGWIAMSGVLALALLPFHRSRRYSVFLLAISVLLYCVFGLGPVAHLLLQPLEQAYNPFPDRSLLRNNDTIVVLTGYASRNAEMPPTDQLNASSAYRLLQALWLQAGRPEANVLISGLGESATVMGEVAQILGIPGEHLLVDNDAADTGVSAENLKEAMKDGRCILVTSAGHMPRAMGVFKQQGIDCTPAPTEFYSTYELGPFSFLPSPRGLVLSDLALHEYLAIAWYRLNGRL